MKMNEDEPQVRRSGRTRKQTETCIYEYIYVSKAFIKQYNKGFKESSKKKKNKTNSTMRKKAGRTATLQLSIHYDNQNSQDSGISSLSKACTSIPSSSRNLRSCQKPPEPEVLSPICETVPLLETPCSPVENSSPEQDQVLVSESSEKPMPEKSPGKYRWLGKAPVKLRSPKETKLLAMATCLNDRESGINTGYLCLKGNGVKPFQILKKHHMLYSVIEGLAEVKVQNDVATVGLYDCFLVKKGRGTLLRI